MRLITIITTLLTFIHSSHPPLPLSSPLAIDLWKYFLNLVMKSYKNGKMNEDEVRNHCFSATSACNYHTQRGNEVWEMLLDFELALIEVGL